MSTNILSLGFVTFRVGGRHRILRKVAKSKCSRVVLPRFGRYSVAEQSSAASLHAGIISGLDPTTPLFYRACCQHRTTARRGHFSAWWGPAYLRTMKKFLLNVAIAAMYPRLAKVQTVVTTRITISIATMTVSVPPPVASMAWSVGGLEALAR